ncbi:MAG TPA: MBL fold metallo-hydrolase [Elusimicrobia bacterium]|jgi:flavorubredoxin|nr:MBL fold metallo-hydrolase [Elusimicrobiota bacterium]
MIKLKDDVYWVGVRNPDLRKFDILLDTPWGTTYNSYLIKAEKIALIDTVWSKFTEDFLKKIKSLVNLQEITYIILNHLEPDHSSSLPALLKETKNATVVFSRTAEHFYKNTFRFPSSVPSLKVGDGESINLGNKNLKFISAPFLHWPDTMFTYLEDEKSRGDPVDEISLRGDLVSLRDERILFPCDCFGCHFCPETEEKIFNDLAGDFSSAFQYYFSHIIRPYKEFVLPAVEKLTRLSGNQESKIEIIAPSHGPILRKDPWKYVNQYVEWSTPPKRDKKKIIIFYVSAWGMTEKIAKSIEQGTKSVENLEVNLYDASQVDLEKMRDEIELADGIILGSPTVCGDVIKPIWDILAIMSSVKVKGKKAAAFGSYGWSGEAVKLIEERLKALKMKVIESGLRFCFMPTDEDLDKCRDFGKNFASEI